MTSTSSKPCRTRSSTTTSTGERGIDPKAIRALGKGARRSAPGGARGRRVLLARLEAFGTGRGAAARPGAPARRPPRPPRLGAPRPPVRRSGGDALSEEDGRSVHRRGAAGARRFDRAPRQARRILSGCPLFNLRPGAGRRGRASHRGEARKACRRAPAGPIDVEALAVAHGAMVLYAPLSTARGMLVRTGTSAIIHVDARAVRRPWAWTTSGLRARPPPAPLAGRSIPAVHGPPTSRAASTGAGRHRARGERLRHLELSRHPGAGERVLRGGARRRRSHRPPRARVRSVFRDERHPLHTSSRWPRARSSLSEGAA